MDGGGRPPPFWRSSEAPAAWDGPDSAVAGAVRWETAAPGLEVGELDVAGDGSAWRLRLVLVRLDPRLLSFDLDERRSDRRRGAWSVADVPEEVRVALNAGQFAGGSPWGWIVREGLTLAAPERAPLGMALVVDTAGGARLVQDDELERVVAGGGVRTAFQSYPAVLLDEGRVPDPLRAEGRGVDVHHRDARLALAELRDGRLLLVLTRFDALGDRLGGLPFGPTTPEMAGLLGALGARRAVLLDGGLSAQLRVSAADGSTRVWRGMRRVPLGLLVRSRTAEPTG